ncbi:hypothetical protein [Bosea sp. (in: a-proteobacteria)]|uniref:hypothetical protein n=1 Tax=Bosea sp. (in: a-proteobacteria) TaxID=1871050 RepID=UPI002DDCF69F|nr:hypothetical protein [Bosea sp. (in: a-proteobacteria)]HEV2508645.1 hypothetical protein [Bosea sp. (in: a-proteobacteria)]
MEAKSFKEFALECKAAQRAVIRKERERMEKVALLWAEYAQALSELGLHPMAHDDILKRRRELDRMAAEIDRQFGDNETMRASYEAYLRRLTHS